MSRGRPAGRYLRLGQPGRVDTKEQIMYRTIVIAFSSLDGVVEDPDGRAGTPNGGWAFRHGPEAVSGDVFKLGPVLDTGVLLLGRKTWQLFSRIWPERTDEFSAAMNRTPKLVASRTPSDLSAWVNSSPTIGDLLEAVSKQKTERDVIVSGSASIVHALAEQDLIDEYRILVFPELIGGGTRLFTPRTVPARLSLVSAETVGPAILARYERAAV
jgi:dihydrofolate reductase